VFTETSKFTTGGNRSIVEKGLWTTPVYPPEEQVEVTALQLKYGVYGRCQNVAELTGGKLV
jgi:hypothetical protein